MNHRLVIVGVHGRMGQALVRLAPGEGFEILAGVGRGDRLEEVIAHADVVIEFANPEATLVRAKLAALHQKPLVIGTTGHEQQDRQAILELSTQVPMIFSPNYSVGINVLFDLTQRAATLLGDSWDVEMVEAHHRFKKDAPSGTAKKLLEIVTQVRRQKQEEVVRHGREGEVVPRKPHEIGMHALRGGDIVGEHTVVLTSMGERLELVHRASSRDIFARGALRAAHWLLGKQPALYEMKDVFTPEKKLD